MAVISAVPAAHDRAPVAQQIPREAAARTEVVAVAPLRHVDIGDRDREDRGIQIFVAAAIQAFPAEAEIQRQIRPQPPVVLHEGDRVLRRARRVDRRKAGRERRRSRQRRDRRRIGRIEELVAGKGEGAEGIAGVLLEVRHVVVLAAELHVVRRVSDVVGVPHFPPALRPDLVEAASIRQRREVVRRTQTVDALGGKVADVGPDRCPARRDVVAGPRVLKPEVVQPARPLDQRVADDETPARRLLIEAGARRRRAAAAAARGQLVFLGVASEQVLRVADLPVPARHVQVAVGRLRKGAFDR